jgi:hypothetical protein
MYEFITIGGGQYFVDFFNGVASLMKSEDYLDTVKIVGTIAFMWMLLNSAFQMSLEYSAKWFVTIFLTTQILITPKTTLHITDKTNPALQGATVDNVPFVIAYLASASSQIGYSLTSQFEAVYSLPDDLKYQNNGMIFGVNLMETVANATIYNSRFSETMDSFVRNCIAYDILLDSYSFDDLKSAPDIWEFISPFQSENRFFTYLSDGNPVEYPSCKEGINKLGASWNSELAEWHNSESKKVNFISQISIFGKSSVNVKKQVLTSLASNTDIVSDYLMGVSMTSGQMLKQAMTNNAIIAATENYEAEYNQQLYQNTRAMVQARSSYQTIGMQANHWLPILKIVIESVFYAAFPIVVLLTMIPNMTMAVLRGYCSTFFWLASWSPLYAILHRLMIDGASNKMTDGQAFSLFNQQNIQSIVIDVSVMAGYWAMSIPIISYGLARVGVAAMSSVSNAFMSVAQGAAIQAAQEGTTGNLSFGNVSLNSRHAYSGITMQNDSGMLTHYHKDGSNSIARGTSESDTGYNIHASDRLEHIASQSIAQERALAQSSGFQSQQMESKGYESLLQNHRNIENSKQFSEQFSADEKRAFSNIANSTEAFAVENNINRNKAAEIFAKIGAGVAGADARISSQDQDLYQKAQRFSEERHLSDDFQTLKSSAQSNHLNFTDSQGQSINDHFNKSAQLSKEQSIHLENAERYSKQKQFIQSNSAGIDKTYNQEFYNYVRANLAGGSAQGAADLFNPNDASRHQILDKAAGDFLDNKFHNTHISESFDQDYKYQATQFLNQNSPRNLMANEAPVGFDSQFQKIDNSSLENATSQSYDDMRQKIGQQTIDQSSQSQVIEEQKRGVAGGFNLANENDVKAAYEKYNKPN